MNHIPRINIKLIDPSNQRFSECGDWFYDAEDDVVTVFVSRMVDWRSEIAVAIHEVLESVMCLEKGIDQTDIDLFDKKFYQEHEIGEAGDDKNAPYFEQHKSATFVEQEVCSQLVLPWDKHSNNCDDV